jgi:hypothetical protein
MQTLTLELLLKIMGVTPDAVSGRFFLESPIRRPGDPSGTPYQKFRIRDGQLFDGFNGSWTLSEFEQAVRTAGLLPDRPKPDGVHCCQCQSLLNSSQTKFCGEECAKLWKRQRTREKRGFRHHVHVCRDCGKKFRVGRPPVKEQAAGK